MATEARADGYTGAAMTLEQEQAIQILPASSQELEPELQAEPTYRDSLTGRLIPGRPSLNPLGRPRKGQSFHEQYRKMLEDDVEPTNAQLKAARRRMLKDTMVGARAFEDAQNRIHGMVAQKYVIETGESPADGLRRRLAALRGIVVDAEVRELSEGESHEPSAEV